MLIRSAASDPRGKSVTKHEASGYATEPQIDRRWTYMKKEELSGRIYGGFEAMYSLCVRGKRSRETRDFGSTLAPHKKPGVGTGQCRGVGSGHLITCQSSGVASLV